MKEPKLIYRVPPEYPESAIRHPVGDVVLELHITTGKGLLRKWKFCVLCIQ